MRARVRLAAASLTTLTLLGGTVAGCSGEAPETSQDDSESGADDNQEGGSEGDSDEGDD